MSRKSCSTCRRRAVNIASEGGSEKPTNAYIVLDSWTHSDSASPTKHHHSNNFTLPRSNNVTEIFNMSNQGKGSNQMTQADASRIQSSQVHSY